MISVTRKIKCTGCGKKVVSFCGECQQLRQIRRHLFNGSRGYRDQVTTPEHIEQRIIVCTQRAAMRMPLFDTPGEGS
jgi:hypothetical protein